jgi:hypothetical protein
MGKIKPPSIGARSNARRSLPYHGAELHEAKWRKRAVLSPIRGRLSTQVKALMVSGKGVKIPADFSIFFNFSKKFLLYMLGRSIKARRLSSAMLLSESGLFLPIFWRNEPDISVDL